MNALKLLIGLNFNEIQGKSINTPFSKYTTSPSAFYTRCTEILDPPFSQFWETLTPLKEVVFRAMNALKLLIGLHFNEIHGKSINPLLLSPYYFLSIEIFDPLFRKE